MFEIYQVHETCGQYEDYHDYVIGSFLHEKVAEKFLKKCNERKNKEKEQIKKCENCPIHDFNIKNDQNINVLKQYCKYFELDNSGYLTCKNECFLDLYEPNYRIEVVFVSEEK